MDRIKRLVRRLAPWIAMGLLLAAVYGWGYRDGRSRGFEAGSDAMRRAILQVIHGIAGEHIDGSATSDTAGSRSSGDSAGQRSTTED